MIRLALFASGTGSNVYNIIKYFSNSDKIKVELVLSNKKGVGALKHASDASIAHCSFNRDDFFESNSVLNKLSEYKIDYLILAGFLWKVPENLINAYAGKIINVHPALLPAYGGKGMYGMHVHKAVVEADEKRSGITIHQVNENYDEGAIIAQFDCLLSPTETPASLVEKIKHLEKEYFPKTIEEYILANS